MRTEQLQYMIDLTKTGSINKTAQHFFISQQSVSNSIRQLERELDCPLLNRTATGVSLTSQGLLVADFAHLVLANQAKLLDQLSQINSGKESTDKAPIDIHSASIILNMSLPNILDEFSHSYPQNHLRIFENTPDKLFDTLRQKQCDLAFITIRQDRLEHYLAKTQEPPVLFIPIFEDHLVICASATSPYYDLDYIESDLFAKSMRTLFGFTPTEEYAQRPIHPYENSITVSNDVEFQKRMLLQDCRLMALMPYTAYRLFFSSRRFIARPLFENIDFIHAILIAPYPRPIVLNLVDLIQKRSRLL